MMHSYEKKTMPATAFASDYVLSRTYCLSSKLKDYFLHLSTLFCMHANSPHALGDITRGTDALFPKTKEIEVPDGTPVAIARFLKLNSSCNSKKETALYACDHG